jgi:hypothetical protein
MPPGPSCRCPTDALSLSLFLSRTTAAATGPCLAPVLSVSHTHPVSRVAEARRPPLFAQQRCSLCLMVSSPPPIADEGDILYHQLVEIHAIGVAQLAECAHWRRSDPTPSPVRASTGRRGPDGTSSVTRIAPPPPTGFFSQFLLRQPGSQGEPLACRQDHQVSTWHERHMRNQCYDKPSGQRRSCGDPGGCWQGRAEAVHMAEHFRDPSRH